MSELPLSMSVSLQRAAIKTGLRSDIGLAVMMFPPTAWNEKQLSLKGHTTTEPAMHIKLVAGPQCETCRNVANLQPGEPAQLLQHGEEDLGLVRGERLHRLPKHSAHVAKSARCAKHNSYKNRLI